MPTDQQPLLPLGTELESARIPRVKAWRKDVISTGSLPHPLKDDKLLLDAKMKCLSLSSSGPGSPRRVGVWQGLLQHLKALIHLLKPEIFWWGC